MATWKVLLIAALSCVCLALGLATLLVPLSHEGNHRWAWLGGLAGATACVTGLFALFLRHAGNALDAKAARGRY